ncbi:hypothetical protein N7532_004979 [Penicillium argentinense]|uniref:Ubiquitin-protein ligase n=1 Tax=Penicillium argentinense TaxID=1131581 RepID=A0A9W9K9H4_9EURO|nr:uncharacterized protein N7532_004979 [Penicillium argentinense]KAJ5097978.1 hypothetical protein N7532_004979 [Penicillium argentinense]
MSSVPGPAEMPSATSTSLAQNISTTLSSNSGFSFLPAFPLELITAPLRVLNQAETFAFSTVPRHLLRLAGIENIEMNFWGVASPAAGDPGLAGDAMGAAADMAGGAHAATVGDSWYLSEFLMAAKKIGGFIGWLTSMWSFTCLMEALILNRITIYASTRRHLRLGWERRLALRIVPLVLLASQILSLLRGIRCQTAPSYSIMRYGHPGKPLAFDYAPGGGTLHWLSSSILSWESDEQACSAVQMGRAAGTSDIPFGTFSLLWPVFLRLCLSHFVETLSCALHGKPVMTETGMSIFEHSLAFAEAESMISKSIGLGIFGLPKQNPLHAGATEDAPVSPLRLLTRAQVLDRMNVTPELLLIALISCCNSLTSHALDVIGKQSRYRLFNTAFWGLCYMTVMLWGLESGPPVSAETGVLKFPTVCTIGFIPHMLVFVGIIACFNIYALALTITAFSLPSEEAQPISIRERFALAHENMQGANQIRSIRINRHEDFYTTLLRVGYVALTAASEAVFLNEGKVIIARSMTWLERDRLAEIEASRQRNSSYGDWSDQSQESLFDAVSYSGFDLPEQSSSWESGYNREKKIEKSKNGSRAMRPHAEVGGVGVVQGSLRFWHVISFFRSIFWLVLRWMAYGANRALDRMGITARPQWLKRLLGTRENKGPGRKSSSNLDFWILTEEGELELPANHEFDVELEMRKRERCNQSEWERNDERRLDDRLYGWWKFGGSWGDQDHTSDYNPSVADDDDTTSMVSMSTHTSEDDWQDEEEYGRRTPTQTDPYPSFSRESTPFQDPVLDMGQLARLLDPRDRESREEARILAAHLTPGGDSARIMTRSQYRQQVERQRSHVLFSSRLQMASQSANDRHKPTAEEESEVLEKLILSCRSETISSPDPNTWKSGAMGLGENGPPCVVCQTNPRSIITWPCRCLCICEDCRVSLAMNNFGSCVTCRQEVSGFMRLWVP